MRLTWKKAKQIAKRFLFQKKVSFIIVGAQKSGTTALYHFLGKHPRILMSSKKETNYFVESSFKKDENNFEGYHKYFKTKIRKSLLGEASPSYMLNHNIAARRIFNYNPKIKIIVILKNPVERTYSQYKMHVKKYGLNLSFEECLKISKKQPLKKVIYDETSGLSSETLKSYLEFSNYTDQIKSFQQFFLPSQILFLKNEDLLNNHSETLKCIFNFLNLKNHVVKNEMIHSFEGEELEERTRNYLNIEFLPQIKELEKLLNWDLSNWKI